MGNSIFFTMYDKKGIELRGTFSEQHNEKNSEESERVKYKSLTEDVSFILNSSDYGNPNIEIIKTHEIDIKLKDYYLKNEIFDEYEKVFINKYVFADKNGLIYATKNRHKDIFKLVRKHSTRKIRKVTDIKYKVKKTEEISAMMDIEIICGNRRYKYKNIKILDNGARRQIKTSFEEMVENISDFNFVVKRNKYIRINK